MQAKNIMTTPVVSVSDTSTVQEVAKVLLDRNISAVPVVDPSGTVVGIVSEGDLMHRAEAGTRRSRSWWLSLFVNSMTLADEFVKEHSRKVSDVMTRNVITAAPEAQLSAIATMLENNRIKRLPIIENGRLVGIVSRANLLQALATLDSTTKSAALVDDVTIREAVLECLQKEPWSPSWLNVTVQDGVVDIWGMANSEAEKNAARVAAETTPGVVAVKENIVRRAAVYGA